MVARTLLPVALSLAFSLAGCRATPPSDRAPPPRYEPPPPRGEPLTRDAALEIVKAARDPDEAIRRLDERRFEFAITLEAVRWFRQHGAAPEVIDYLEKRGLIDHDATRGDVDYGAPAAPRTGYVDPRLGFEDFGGTAAPQRSPFAHDPWTGPSLLGIPWGLGEEKPGKGLIYRAPTGERYIIDRR